MTPCFLDAKPFLTLLEGVYIVKQQLPNYYYLSDIAMMRRLRDFLKILALFIPSAISKYGFPAVRYGLTRDLQAAFGKLSKKSFACTALYDIVIELNFSVTIFFHDQVQIQKLRKPIKTRQK